MTTITQENVFYPTRNWDIDVGLATDAGCERDRNEDRLVFFQPDDPNLLERKGSLALVADGMGGHMAGGLASQLAVELINKVYYNEPRTPRTSLLAAFKGANHGIYQMALQNKAYRGMGTTCTAFVVQGGWGYCAHAGDSRLYLIRGEEIRLMTEDHSLVGEMLRAGIISAENARAHPEKNVISRALGVRPHVEPFTWQEPIELFEDDIFVLCSDGLYDLVEDAEIKDLAASQPVRIACEELVALAKKRGGHDNISVGLFRLLPGSP